MSASKLDRPAASQKQPKSDEIKGFMKRSVIFVSGETPMSEVVMQMRDLNISSVLVVDHLLDVVGIITERDIVQKFTLLDLKHKLSSKAFAVMSRPLIVARLDHLFNDVQKHFLEHKIRHFPITNGGSKAQDIVGIVTVTDLASRWLNVTPAQGSSMVKPHEQIVVVVGVDANRALYSKLFKALSMEPIIDADNETLVRRAVELKTPAVLDLDGLSIDEIKRYLARLKVHSEPVLLLSSHEKLIEPLKKAMNSEVFQVAIKPLDVSEVMHLLNRVDAHKKKNSVLSTAV